MKARGFAVLALMSLIPGFAAIEPARAAAFDGPWTVVIVTQSGNCDAAYSFPLRVSGGRVVSTGGAPPLMGGSAAEAASA